MLDDFAEVGSVLMSGFGLMRGLGLSIWALVQDLLQLKSAYPQDWQTLFAKAHVISVLGVGDRETESYISKLAGGGTTGAEARVLAEEIRRRRPELSVMVREGRPLLCRRIEYFRDEPFAVAARPDPHYKGGEGGGA
jgi:type IV secretory pathway TraG/TraD family ATPase VirD4